MTPTTHDHFLLDEAEPFEFEQAIELAARWTEFPHAPGRQRGMVLLAGEALRTPPLRIASDAVLWLRALRGLDTISEDGAQLAVHWHGLDSGDSRELAVIDFHNASPAAGLVELSLAWPACDEAFRIELRGLPGPRALGDADWIGLLEAVVCDAPALPLLRARSQHGWRLANEIAHFAAVYDNAFYADRHARQGQRTLDAAPEPLPPVQPVVDAIAPDALEAAAREVEPLPGENAFGFAHRVLGRLLPMRPPDFPARMRALAGHGPLRMLALCAGAGAIEAGIIARADVDVELCIVDVNETLIRTAAASMPARVTLRAVVGDANRISPALGRFDLVTITSGLHHLVELEHVLSSIAAMLTPHGEFWLIGEQVGRNGNRLWPEALAAANALFAPLPEAKRLNRNSGRVDATVPDIDCSAACFEGIRSQDISGLLERHFVGLDVYLRNAFLWRLVGMAYAANYDLDDPGDVALLRGLAVAEARHWADGGRGTELHGAFASRRARLAGHLRSTNG